MALAGGGPASAHSTTPTVGMGALTWLPISVKSQGGALLPQPAAPKSASVASRQPAPGPVTAYLLNRVRSMALPMAL